MQGGARLLRSRMRRVRGVGDLAVFEGEKEGLPRGGMGRLADGGKKGPTVGRRCDPP